MSLPFVKKFDFRGVYNKDIFDKDAFYLALAIKKTIPLKKVLVGWDSRVSSKNLAMNFMHALKNANIEIQYLNICPIDYVTAAAHAFDFDFSVMFTGSHNPWDWTGLLMHTKGGASVEGATVTDIVENYTHLQSTPYSLPQIQLADYLNVKESVEDVYKKKIQSLIPLKKIKKMRVLVDVGDGSGSISLDVLEKLLPQVSFHRIHDRRVYDDSSSHTADPSNIENMQELMDTVKKDAYDCGFAFDSDADRVLAVDETGAYLNGSLLGSAMIDVFTQIQKQMHTFGYAVECGPAMYNAVADIRKKQNIQISAIPVPVGRSILRRLIRNGTIDMGVENVGHFYMKDFFMTDSGAFSLAVILYWISVNSSLSSVREKYPDGLRTQFALSLAQNQEAILHRLTESITPHFAQRKNKRIEIDGIRYEFFEGDSLKTWYAMRTSGYEKIEKYYFGSLDEADYTFLQEKIRKE